MRLAILLAAGTSLALVAAAPSSAIAKVKIDVDLSTQTIHVEGKDKTYDWKISSGASGYETPTGSYKVLWTDKDHYSDEYDGAPMPNAIFFKPGFAIHGSYKSNWGHPASHGCVRIPVAKSAILFDMVKKEGGAEINLTGDTPATMMADKPARRRDAAVSADAGPAVARRTRGYEDADGYGGDRYYEPAPAPAPASRPYEDPGFGGFFGGVY